jgi:hypothetical protein
LGRVPRLCYTFQFRSLYGRVAEPGLCHISAHYDENLVVYDGDFEFLFDDYVVPGCYYDFNDPFLPYLFGVSDDSTLRYPGSDCDSAVALQVGLETREVSPSSGDDSDTLLDEPSEVTSLDVILDGIDPTLLSHLHLGPAPAASPLPQLLNITMPISTLNNDDTPDQRFFQLGKAPPTKRQRDEDLDESDQDNKRPKRNEQYYCFWGNCATTHDDVSDLRSHVRDHAEQAMRCGWRNCDRAPESAALIK